jgi:hypothetical protein
MTSPSDWQLLAGSRQLWIVKLAPGIQQTRGFLVSQPPANGFARYVFTEAEMARLSVNKAAVAAGLFSDTCPETPNS